MKNKTLEPIGSIQIGGIEFEYYGDIYEPLFLAKDVATLLNERDGSTVARKVHKSEKATHKVCTLGGVQNSTFLTEFGLYEVFMKSSKEEALQFKGDVKNQLKQIRLRGGYIADHDKYISTASQEEIDELTHKLKLEDYINRSLIRQLKNKQQDLHKAWEVQNQRGEVIKLYNELLEHLDQSLLTREEVKIIGRIEMTKELYNM